MAKSVAKNVDLELGDGDDIFQKSFESLLRSVKYEHYYANTKSPIIYKAPSTLRDLSPTSFDPQVVSIGPLHRDDANVQAFEARKVTYLHNLLHRVNYHHPEKPLKISVLKVASSIDQIKACYAGMIKTYDSIKLTKMMVMDACFILEFINQKKMKSIPLNMLLAQSITYDLMLLENQIPFFVLNDVFTTLNLEPDTHLIEFIGPVLNSVNLFQTKLKLSNIISTDYHDHLLGVLHKCYQPHDPIDQFQSDFSTSRIRSAAELDRAWVKFKPNQDENWVMAMDVRPNGVPCYYCSWCKTTLRMPVLRINHFTDLVLRNLIAYEQTSSSLDCITSYALAMDMLIDTQEDIAKLEESKVLVNLIGSNEEAATMINSICKQVAWVDFFYVKQWEQLERHCNGYWPRNIAWLKRTYFSNPWNGIALLAGIFLFGLTIVQTIFTVKPAK